MQCKCGQEAGEWQFVDFDYAGLRFSHMAKDSSTCLECLKKQTAERFEKFGRELVSLKDGKIKVNWELYKGHVFENEDKISQRNKYTLILEELGIFSMDRSGNFVFKPDPLNIRIDFIVEYAFTRLEDIIEYGRVVLGNEEGGSWVINLVFEKTLLSKEGVLGLT